MDKSKAAVKVQKVFRAFSVRKSAPLKNFKIIAKVRAQTEEIRKHLSDAKAVESIRRDQKQKLKISEWIMSLLLQLDAIQGVNSVVRDYRKVATRELVNLQETVDAIIAGKPMEDEEVVDATGTENILSSREEATEDIGMVREENKRLTTMVADLLKKREKQNQMIDDLSIQIAQLEEQVSSKKKIADQRKKTRGENKRTGV